MKLLKGEYHMLLRRFEITDLDAVLDLYYDSVHRVMAQDYSEEALNALAPRQANRNYWENFLMKDYTVVVTEDDQIVGFGNVGKTGYLDLLYVSPDHLRQGIATMIADDLEAHARDLGARTLNTSSTITSRPFFEKRGYQMIQKQKTERHHVIVLAYLMEKTL